MMRRHLRTRMADERGIAMITAIMVVAVLVTLGITSAGLAIHNTEQSGRDRQRVQGIAAAEAGVNYYFAHFQAATVDAFQCSIDQELPVDPGVRFEATATFYDAAQQELACPLGTDLPTSVLIRSTGTTAAGAAPRVMEAYVQLVPILGAPFGDTAIFSQTTPTFNSNVNVFGGSSQDGNVYTNGNFVLSSNSIIHGAVYAQGNITIGSNAEVKRDVWGNGSVEFRTNARTLENAISSTSSIAMASGSRVYGDARAGTTITTSGTATIDGLRIPSSPQDPPPARDFPGFTYDPAPWEEAGFTVNTFGDCASAKTFIEGIAGGDHVVRITSACLLEWPSNSGPTVRGHLAIISEGGLRMNSNSSIRSDGGDHDLFLIMGLGGVTPCDITFESNTTIATGLKTLLYTPCTIVLNSNSFVIEGQMFGNSVRFNSNATVNFSPIDVPGEFTGRFKEDIVYLREVVAGS